MVNSRGALSEHAPRALLAWCEEHRFTGRLHFTPTTEATDETDGADGEVPLLAGQPEVSSAPGDLAQLALERFLALSDGEYTLEQLLPPREHATQSVPTELEGPLSNASVADLMQYCERTGLTGQLVVRLEERTCSAEYTRGDLVSLTLDGDPDDDVAAVFDWRRGTYRVLYRSLFSNPPTSTPHLPSPPPGDALLKTFEVALADILGKRDRALTPSLRPPSLRPLSSEGARPEEDAAAAPRSAGDDVVIPRAPRAPAIDSFSGPSTDTTVKVYFVQPALRAPAPLPPAPATPSGAPARGDGAERADADATTDPPPVDNPRGPRRGDPSLPPELTRVDLALGAVLTAALVIAAIILGSLLVRG